MWQTKAESFSGRLVNSNPRERTVRTSAALRQLQILRKPNVAPLLCSSERCASCRTESFNIRRLDSIANLSPFVTLTKYNLTSALKNWILGKECIYMWHMILIINCDCVPKQHQSVGLYKGVAFRWLCGWKWLYVVTLEHTGLPLCMSQYYLC